MATIVMLPARRQGLPVSTDQTGGATILFFTGVRYEREAECEPDADADAPLAGDPGQAAEARIAG